MLTWMQFAVIKMQYINNPNLVLVVWSLDWKSYKFSLPLSKCDIIIYNISTLSDLIMTPYPFQYFVDSVEWTGSLLLISLNFTSKQHTVTWKMGSVNIVASILWTWEVWWTTLLVSTSTFDHTAVRNVTPPTREKSI